MKSLLKLSVIFVLLLSGTSVALAGDPKLPKKVFDFTKGDKLPKDISHDWNLGPIGARGWMQVSEAGASGTTKNSRQILITEVSQNGPASSVLKPDDVILGMGEDKFSADARITFAKAIREAESSEKGKLEVMRFRGGKTDTVTINIRRFEQFSATAPQNCKKSALILKEGCDRLASQGLGEGIPAHINALALLATGDRRYEKTVVDHAADTCKRPLNPTMALGNWYFGFTNLFLTEYYLATKDKRVLKEITRLSDILVRGQGPIGTWGHKPARMKDGYLQGYGAVNAVGLPCAISLVLARECNVKVKGLDEAIEKSTTFFSRHVSIGTIPYGDGQPSTKYGHDDNGKSSAAAILFSLVDNKVATDYFARSALAAHGADREQGHTGNFLNMFWSLPAVNLCGSKATGAWLEEFGWYYDLARDPNYQFKYQGYPRESSNGKHSKWRCPGAYLLHFAAHKKMLRMTGKGVTVMPELSDEEIANAIEAGKDNYKEASKKFLREALASWSPIVRSRAAKELRNRGIGLASGASWKSKDIFERIAAINNEGNFKRLAKMLEDPDLSVRIAAATKLAKQNRNAAFAMIMKHLADHPEEDEGFVQIVGFKFFPERAKLNQVAPLIKGQRDREALQVGLRRMLDGEDALLSGSVVVALQALPRNEMIPLLPEVYKYSKLKPKGNVMFAERFQKQCIDNLNQLKLQEGVEASAYLLADLSWGKGKRLPGAAKMLLKNRQYAHAYIPVIEESVAELQKSGEKQWEDLLKNTIKEIQKTPKAKKSLMTLEELIAKSAA